MAWPSGVLAREMAIGERLVDHGHPGRRRHVVLVDHASAKQLDPQGVEELCVDLVQVGLGLLARLRRRPAHDGEGMRPDLHGEPRGDARAGHAGQGTDPLQDPVVELLDLRRHQVHVLRRLVEVLGPSEKDVGGEQPLRVEPRKVALLAQEGAHHEAGTHQQDHGQAHLGHEQRVATALAPAAAAPSAFLQDVVQVDPRRPQRGQQAEHQARGDGHHESEEQDARVHVDVAEKVGEALGHEKPEEPRAPEREAQAEGAAHEGKEHVLGEELGHEAPAARARGRAQRQLLLARRARPRGAGSPRSRTR